MEHPIALPDGDKQDNGPRSMDIISMKEAFPLPRPNIEEGATLPSGLKYIPGEAAVSIGRTLKGTIILTNYRLVLSEGSNLARIPVRLIGRIETLDIVHIKVTTKIGRSFVLTFGDNALCMKWCNLLLNIIEVPFKLHSIFAFYYRAYILEGVESSAHGTFSPTCSQNLSLPIDKEFERMKFNPDFWQITDINFKFDVCSTYPKYHIIPRATKKQSLQKLACFRSGNRFPSVVWRSQRTGAVILRCAQPCVGIMLWRCPEDENLVHSIADSCNQDRGSSFAPSGNRRLLIVDARNYGAAQLNRIKGGGFEFAEYYDRTEINFMSLPNIHTVRDSFEKLISLYSVKSDLSWFANLEKSSWLYNLSLLLKSSLEIVIAVHYHSRPVMVHCTDGWDRTPQLTSLSLLLLDPFYRTIEGFKVLVEREWLDFGHKFGDRCGHGVSSNSPDERSPVFLQWLDCVHQVLRQYPQAFEFNETFLVKLNHHVYSTLFGTFLCNSLKERLDGRIQKETCSIWDFFQKSNWHIYNYLFDRTSKQVLLPSCQLRDMVIWKAVYVGSLITPSSELDTRLDISSCTLTSPDQQLGDTSLPPSAGSSGSLRRARSSTDISSLSGTGVGEDESLCSSSGGTNSTCAPLHHHPSSPGYRESSVPPALISTSPPSPRLSSRPVLHSMIPPQAAAAAAAFTNDSPSVTPVISVPHCQATIPVLSSSDGSACCDGEDASVSTIATIPTNELLKGVVANASPLCSSTDTLTETNILGSVAAAANSPVSPFMMDDQQAASEDEEEAAAFPSTEVQEASIAAPSSEQQQLRDPLPSETEGETGLLTPLLLDLEDGDHKTPPSKAAGGVGELPRSLGYGTGSDLSTPFSSGPSTPDIQDRLPALRDDYFRCLDCEYEAEGSDCETAKNTSSSTISSLTDHRKRVPLGVPLPRTNGHRQHNCESSSKLDGGGSGADTESLDDFDGLTVAIDPVTRYIHQLRRHYDSQLSAIQAELVRTQEDCRILRSRQEMAGIDNSDNVTVPSDSSFDQVSNVSSSEGSSFDTIDDSEGTFTRWVPDHLAKKCFMCNAFFNLMIRRHHCRSCGGVFCYQCANYFTPVPDQQLQESVRVCKECFTRALVPPLSPSMSQESEDDRFTSAPPVQCNPCRKPTLQRYPPSSEATSKA